jgi:hypothetical protein
MYATGEIKVGKKGRFKKGLRELQKGKSGKAELRFPGFRSSKKRCE